MTAPMPRPRCFAAARPAGWVKVESRLPDAQAVALSRLLPVLGCGEEAAGLAFTGLAETQADDPRAAATLRGIAAEETVHDGLIHSIAAALPPPPEQPGTRRRARRFHLEMGRDDPAARFARIAALDSAVCQILSRLLRPGAPIARDPQVAAIFRLIARDEARHVRATRSLAMARAEGRALREIAAPVRAQLAQLLGEAADAFDQLAFDPRWLRDDIARLPNGLFR